ncbi:MAG: hydantoinase/oxoprolinase family protein [Rhodobacteraceae bacterium]|nr:hydantoinase/oxoprolinase family protein [Paracoccaceae bacterium]
MIRLATDVGGTFTDLLGYDEITGRIYSAKSLTTVDNQSRGVLDTIRMAEATSGLEPSRVGFFVHGGTTVINAITERKGVRTALITTRGFRDVLEIGRGNRPDLYNLRFHSPAPYVERHLRLEVSERVDPDGTVVVPIAEAEIEAAAETLRADKVEAVAILFLNSYAYPDHERRCAERLADLVPGLTICASHEISRVWREFERSNTAVLNAYVKPIISRYFRELEIKLVDAAVRCAHYAMLSNGGVASFQQAAEAPLNLVESGPSGGIAGAVRIGELLGEPNVLALDVGGTTAKCSVIVDGKPRVFSDYRLEHDRHTPGYPVQVPVVDIVEIGAGGGSIARVDAFGALTVGPDSAGANPGPVCYGLGGTEPTVTDAKLITGVIDAGEFAEGRMRLDLDAARRAMTALGGKLGKGCEETAEAIVELAEANMINALKLVTIQRGHDPRDFTLVVTGGAGPLFAANLGRELNAKRVVIPPHAGIFSAWGMLAAKPRIDQRRTWFRELGADAIAPLNEELTRLKQSSLDYFGAESSGDLDHIVSIHLRYRGQEHSVTTQIDGALDQDGIAQSFHAAHAKSYSFALPETAIEITGLHLVTVLNAPVISLPRVAPDGLSLDGARTKCHRIYFGPDQGWQDSAVYARDLLPPQITLEGPALVREATTTTLVLPGQVARRDVCGLLIIQEKADS